MDWNPYTDDDLQELDGLRDLAPVANGLRTHSHPSHTQWVSVEDRAIDRSDNHGPLPAISNVGRSINRSGDQITLRAFNNGPGPQQGPSSRPYQPVPGPANPPPQTQLPQPPLHNLHSSLAFGNVKAYVMFPKDEQIYDEYGNMIPTVHRMNSSEILDKYPTSKLAEMLNNHITQARIKRRRGDKQLPGGIAYVLDLTFSYFSDDDKAAILCSVMCPQGLLKWYETGRQFGIFSSHIGGMGESGDGNAVIASLNKDGSLEEWSEVRYTIGTVRLLHVLQGGNPDLNSGVKAWTLVKLAHFFECPSAVLDWVFIWITSDRNYAILEVLPEVCIEMGMKLSNETLVQLPFGILVAEQALQTIVSDAEKLDSEAFSKHTVLGRPKDNLDDYIMDPIQYATQSFLEQVKQTVDQLVALEDSWVGILPEVLKLDSLVVYLAQRPNFDKNEYAKTERLATTLKDDLIKYVLGRIMLSFATQPSKTQREEGEKSRRREGCVREPGVKFIDQYNSLDRDGHALFRVFWEMVRYLAWDASLPGSEHTNVPHGASTAYLNGIDDVIARMGAPNENMDKLNTMYAEFNRSVFNAIKEENYNDGVFPVEHRPTFAKFMKASPDASSAMSFSSTEIRKFPPAATYGASSSTGRQAVLLAKDEVINHPSAWDDFPDENRPADIWGDDVPFPVSPSGSTTPTGGMFPMSLDDEKAIFEAVHDTDVHHFTANPSIPAEFYIPEDSPYFSLTHFMNQVSDHVRKVATKMLSRPTLLDETWNETCALITCLDEQQYKFLPVAVGGKDDGTGSVSAPDVPPAERGPITHGPGLHYGSTVPSVDSDLVGYDTMDFSVKAPSTIFEAPSIGTSQQGHNVSSGPNTICGDDTPTASINGEEDDVDDLLSDMAVSPGVDGDDDEADLFGDMAAARSTDERDSEVDLSEDFAARITLGSSSVGSSDWDMVFEDEIKTESGDGSAAKSK